jgi:hypothetical protein
MNGWSPNEVKLANVSSLGAGLTDSVVSKVFRISAGGSKNIAVVLTVSGVTAGSGITAKLQTGMDGVFVDSKTAAVTTAGLVAIKLNVHASADQTFLPLLASGRVVITTAAGASLTVDSINVLQEE